MNQLKNYYSQQLDKIGNPNAGYQSTCKISGPTAATNYMSLNGESATTLIKWLNDHYETGVTLIDNDQRVFQIVKADLGPKQWFTNLAGIPAILQSLRPHDKFTVYEFWDTNPKKVTIKALNGYFEANQIDYRI